MTSTKNKQRDRVASYAGSMLNRAHSGGPSVQGQKKKPYRARGCRGGASRKGRKRQPLHDHPRQDEENDPSLLNAKPEKHAFNIHESDDTASNKRDTKQRASTGSDKQRSSTQDHCQSKARTLSILPKGTGLRVHQGASGRASTPNADDVGLTDQSKHQAKNACDPKPILPNVLGGSVREDTRSSSNVSSAIARPTSATSSDDRGSHRSGGFSFFCISPRSFLSGQPKSKSPRFS